MPSPKEIEMAVASVLRHAIELRQAGVTKLCLDTLTVELAPLPPEHGDVVESVKQPEKPKGIWDDPTLYGRDDDAPVPKLKKE
jgi:hypothetical protein